MVIARLEAVPAACELVHLLQQTDGALEHSGEIDDAVGVERPLELRHGDAKHLPDPAGQDHIEIATKRADRLGDWRSDAAAGLAVALPHRVRFAVGAAESG